MRVLFTNVSALLSLVNGVVLYFTENVEKPVERIQVKFTIQRQFVKKSDYHSVNDQIPLQQLQKFIGLGYATLTIQKQPLISKSGV